MKRLLALLFIFLPLAAQAATVAAASAARADVVTAINAAANGDTVTVPAGSATWTTTIVIPTGKYISIIGAGMGGSGTSPVGGTVITNSAGTVFQWSNTGANFFRVSGFRFISGDLTNVPIIGIKGPATSWRVDNNYFNKGETMVGANHWPNNRGTGPTYGVIDHNIAVNMIRAHFSEDSRTTDIDDGSGLVDGYQAWQNLPTPGSANMIFLENNQFIWNASHTAGNVQGALYGQWAGRACFRNNVCTGMYFYIDAHGDKPGYSTVFFEIYDNVFTESLALGSQGELTWQRGGTWIMHDNQFLNATQNAIMLAIYWPTDIAAGHTIGSGNRDSYFWNNTRNGVAVNPGLKDTAATSPGYTAANCRAGIEYHLAAPTSGQAYFPYTTYTYPHPLVTGGGDTDSPLRTASAINALGTKLIHTYDEVLASGAGGTGGWTLSMSGGAVTVSSVALVGSTVELTLSRTIGIGETGTAAYTQPGNGIEDPSGNDAATFSGVTITNNSTSNQVATPTFSPVAGPYYGAQSVTISSATGGTTIYYTTNGTTPTTGSTLYSTPVSVSAGLTLKALAVKATMTDSAIGTAIYEVDSWSSSGAVFKSVVVPQKTGTFTWAFDVTPSVNNAYTVVSIGPDIFDTANPNFDSAVDTPISIWFTANGVIQARNGASYDAVQVIPYSAATTYRVVVSGDVATDTYSAMVGSQQLATNYAFRAPVADLDNIGLYTVTGTTVINNLSFNAPPNPPVPGAVQNLIIGSFTKQIIHWQTAGLSAYIPNVITNAAYIDTLPFDGLVLIFDDYQDCLGPSYVANYTTLYNQVSPIMGVLQRVRRNWLSVMPGNSGMADPFDSWTQTQANFVALAKVCRDTGLKGIFFDNEEYNVHWWKYPTDAGVLYEGTKTVSEYQEQWRLRGTQVMQAIIAEWPEAKIAVAVGPNRSVTAVPSGAMFSGDPNWMGGYFFMGLFAGAPVGNHVIAGGELYYNRTVTQFSNWKTFLETTLTQSPQSPPLIPSGLFSAWTTYASLTFGIYDQDTVGTPVMSASVLESTLVNAMPYVDEFVWNYSESLDWLTAGAGSAGSWQNAVWNARATLGLPAP